MYRALSVVVILAGTAFARGNEIDLTTTGTGSVTIPAGYEWTDVTVQCWGGGGGGSGGYYINEGYNNGPAWTAGAGCGGGGGAFLCQYVFSARGRDI